MSEHLFIADLHLCAERPETLRCFADFLRGRARQADHLYILGDLFDVWIGDDDPAPPIPQIVAALRALTQAGTRLRLMHGNRDFLLGEDFCANTGARLLSDPCTLDLFGTPTLLMHGDLLCSDDAAYQAFRRQVRQADFIRQFLALPLEMRRRRAQEYRQKSGEANSLKGESIMDVNAQAVAEQMRNHAVHRLIHGHTHRPADHAFLLDGVSAARHVLGEWRGDGAEIVSVTPAGLRRERFSG